MNDDETLPVKSSMVKGTLDMLILQVLSLEDMHGWGICQRIQQVSEGTLTVQQGSLYPALQRLQARGWIEARWQTTENGRRARYYRLTRTGEAQLAAERSQWQRLSGGVNRIMALGHS